MIRSTLVALVVLLSSVAFAADLSVGAPMPEVQAKFLRGEEMFQMSSMRGQVTIINFWASWCGPCKAELPLLQTYFDKHRAEGLEVLAISMDDSREIQKVKQITQAFTFPIAMKSESNFKGLGRIWRMPTTFVVDREGILRKNGHLGDAELTQAELEAVVTPLLAK